jgi:CheY-like chemotaxis protein
MAMHSYGADPVREQENGEPKGTAGGARPEYRDLDEGHPSCVDLAKPRGPTPSVPDWHSDTRVHFGKRLLAHCHVVLLEDDGEALDVVGQILEALGAETERYSDPTELLKKFKADTDILVSDVGLPHMTGLELIRQLRQQGYLGPAIALTAFDGRRDQLASLRAGFNVHLTKPLDRELLIATVAALLGRFEG